MSLGFFTARASLPDGTMALVGLVLSEGSLEGELVAELPSWRFIAYADEPAPECANEN